MIREKVECPECGRMVAENGMKAHMGSKNCNIRKMVNMKKQLNEDFSPIQPAEDIKPLTNTQADVTAETVSNHKPAEDTESFLLTRAQKLAEKRKTRVSVSDRPTPRMTVKATPGTVGRWFNDDGNNIQQAIAKGYDHVPQRKVVGENPNEDGNSSLGETTSMYVGTKKDGSPMGACYMEIEEELYAEDRAAEQAIIDEKMSRIQRSVKGQDKNIEPGKSYGSFTENVTTGGG